jgi:Ca2+/H+ antiporter
MECRRRFYSYVRRRWRIVPIAALIVSATEQLSTRTGDAIGGLLNATFGNAPELIIALVALKAGYLDMVRASIAGAILANLLARARHGIFSGRPAFS